MIKHTVLRFGCIAAICVGLGITMVGCGSATTSSGTATVKSATNSKTIDESGKRAVVKESAVSMFEQATKLSNTNPQGAIDAFRAAAKEEENFAEAWYNIGLLEQNRGNKKEALAAYEKATDMRPSMPEPYVNQARMLIDEGKTDEAEQLLLKIVDEKTGIAPFNVQANLNLGMIYRHKGEEILEKERGGSEPKFSMEGSEKKGEIKNKQAYEMFAKSVVYVRRALAGDSNNIYCYENLSAIYYLMNSLEVARLVCEQAMLKYGEYNEMLQKDLDAGKITKEEYDRKAYTPRDLAAIFNTSGLIYLAEGEVSMGNSEFKKAVEADPTNVPAMLNVAGIAVNVQDYQLAYDLYNKVLALEPNNVEAYLSKGVAARGLGNTDEAETIYRDIIAKYPDYPQAQFNLIILYQEYYQKTDEARQMYVDFTNDPKANAIIPGRVAEAKERIQQIDEMKAQIAKAEAEAARMKKEMEEMERMQKEMEAMEAAQQEGEAQQDGGAQQEGAAE
ncbi:MAG: tetratricopeptide repeat protein [Proteobacteria bacterium]|nr:tetratricopeptide repeat protein [Pseudomonadota bacterium]